MLSAHHEAGRLVEVNCRGTISYQGFMEFRTGFQGLIAEALAKAPKAIVVGDLRETDEMGPEVAPVVLGMLRADNARVERAAHLLTAGTGFHRQYEQIVGASRNPNRQVFTEARALIDWLAPVLTPEELARLRVMLR